MEPKSFYERKRFQDYDSDVRVRFEKNEEVKSFVYAFAAACFITVVLVVLDYHEII
jgi:hypothetical protein